VIASSPRPVVERSGASSWDAVTGWSLPDAVGRGRIDPLRRRRVLVVPPAGDVTPGERNA
jgi:hypothetical protein